MSEIQAGYSNDGLVQKNMHILIRVFENFIDKALSEKVISSKLALEGFKASGNIFRTFNGKTAKTSSYNKNFDTLRVIFEDIRKSSFNSPELEQIYQSFLEINK